jgi:hypothetical protein
MDVMARSEAFHSMKVEELPGVGPLPRRRSDSRPSRESVLWPKHSATGDGPTPIEALGRPSADLEFPPFQESPGSCEVPVSIASGAIQLHSAGQGTGTALSTKPCKIRGSIRFLRRAEKSGADYSNCSRVYFPAKRPALQSVVCRCVSSPVGL